MVTVAEPSGIAQMEVFLALVHHWPSWLWVSLVSEFGGAIEQHDAVAEQAPALLGVAAHHGGEVARLTGGFGTGVSVLAHQDHSRSARRGGRGY